MDAKAVDERARQINKATTEGDPPDTLLSLLEPLKTWTASEKVLRTSKIGVYVNKLRQSGSRPVASLATQLVTKWKTDVKKTGGPTGSPAPSGVKGAAANANGNGAASPAGAGTPKHGGVDGARWGGDKEKRSAVADGVEYKLTGNATRDACIKLMYDGLAFMSEEGEQKTDTPLSSMKNSADRALRFQEAKTSSA